MAPNDRYKETEETKWKVLKILIPKKCFKDCQLHSHR